MPNFVSTYNLVYTFFTFYISMKHFTPLLIILFATNLVAQNGIALIGNDHEINSSYSYNPAKAITKTSFELYDRMIVVEAKLNGEIGKYILDTGSPLLILNQVPQKKSTSIGGISEDGDAELIKVKSFQWAGILSKGIEAIAFDMSKLENALGHKINGLIGQNILNDFELFIDISNRKIQLYKPYRSSLHKEKKYQQKVSFSSKSHIPIITVKINGKRYRFGIDTGAEVNILNENLKDVFDEKVLTNFNSTNLHGLGGASQKVESAELSKFRIKGKNCKNYQFLLTDLTFFEEKYGHKLDGILGHPFLIENILSINYQKQKIYFW
jgi:hypothetical protein